MLCCVNLIVGNYCSACFLLHAAKPICRRGVWGGGLARSLAKTHKKDRWQGRWDEQQARKQRRERYQLAQQLLQRQRHEEGVRSRRCRSQRNQKQVAVLRKQVQH